MDFPCRFRTDLKVGQPLPQHAPGLCFLPMLSDADLLQIQYHTLFVTDEAERIVRENDPDRSPGPRLWLGGCARGNAFGLRTDVPEALAGEVGALLAAEPPFTSREGLPEHLDRYLELLSSEGVPRRSGFGLTYALPHALEYGSDVVLIDSESEEGKLLRTTFSRRGMPPELLSLGFRDTSDLWEPWCIAFHEDQVASVACAARISESGAELGITTVQALRGRGYAAAATAGWTHLKSLQSRTLFYSTQRENFSSQRVAARLGLRFIGPSLRLY